MLPRRLPQAACRRGIFCMLAAPAAAADDPVLEWNDVAAPADDRARAFARPADAGDGDRSRGGSRRGQRDYTRLRAVQADWLASRRRVGGGSGDRRRAPSARRAVRRLRSARDTATRLPSPRTASRHPIQGWHMARRSPTGSWHCGRTMAPRSPRTFSFRPARVRRACGRRSARHRPPSRCCPGGEASRRSCSGADRSSAPTARQRSTANATRRTSTRSLRSARSASTVRTAEQTQIALFWRASPTAIWNPILRKAIESRSLDLAATARADGALLSRRVGCERGVLGGEVRLQLLAAAAGDRERGSSMAIRRDRGGSRLAPARADAAASGVSFGARRQQRRHGVRPAAVVRRCSRGSSSRPPARRRQASCATGRRSAKVSTRSSTRACIPAFTSARPTRSARGSGRQVARFVLTHALRPVRPRHRLSGRSS